MSRATDPQVSFADREFLKQSPSQTHRPDRWGPRSPGPRHLPLIPRGEPPQTATPPEAPARRDRGPKLIRGLGTRIDQPVPAAVQHLERAMILYALQKCGGRMGDTAEMLGLSRKGLYLRCVRYGLEPPEAAADAVSVA